MMRSCLIAFVIATIWATAARATSAYDGSWSLTVITQRGDCDASYDIQLDVRNGVISHPNIVRLNGRVKPNGAVRVSVAVPGKFAAGSGRVNGSSGCGRWSGHSETSKCSGIWTARRN
ncbi:hypothetical protein RHPLAN_56890 [Rhodoplanes sp. Z2-YC6860]|nr:hypothetical protein RHPLAN_56890 [Rhodoplanes sp. Z2-YC6860]